MELPAVSTWGEGKSARSRARDGIRVTARDRERYLGVCVTWLAAFEASTTSPMW
jgi:hypothetical protein